MLEAIISILINLFIFFLLLRMFVSARDAYFSPIFGGIYRATDSVMKPIHRAFRRKPVDTSKVDFLVLIPIALLVLLNGVISGVLNPRLTTFTGVIFSIINLVDAVFLVYVVLILMFSVFYKHARFPSNPFVRTAFKVMEPAYSLIGRFAPPLKARPGVSAFFLGLLLHWAIMMLVLPLLMMPSGGAETTPVTVAFTAFGYSLQILLRLFTFFTWTVIIGALMSWISPDPNNPIVQLIRIFSEPINKPFRKIIPNIGGIDISPIFTILTLQLVAQLGSRLLNEVMAQMPTV